MESKPLNIRSVPESTRQQLRLYAAMTGLKQADAMGKALKIAIKLQETKK